MKITATKISKVIKKITYKLTSDRLVHILYTLFKLLRNKSYETHLKAPKYQLLLKQNTANINAYKYKKMQIYRKNSCFLVKGNLNL